MGAFIAAASRNEALVISGCRHSQSRIVRGGRVFVWPMIQKVERIILKTMLFSVKSTDCYTYNGIPICLTGFVQLAPQAENVEMLHTACDYFLGKTEAEIVAIVQSILEGHQNSVIGTMTVEEIYADRMKFSKQVQESAVYDLASMGMKLIGYRVKDFSDGEGYLKALRQVKVAAIKRNARICECEAERLDKQSCLKANWDAIIREALAKEMASIEKFRSEAKIAKAKRDLELQKAEYEIEVNTKRADCEAAYRLQTAKTLRQVIAREMNNELLRCQKAVRVEQARILLKRKELQATVKEPTDAEKYRLQKLAEANRIRIIAEAKASAEAIRLKGQAEASVLEQQAKIETEYLVKKLKTVNEYSKSARPDLQIGTHLRSKRFISMGKFRPGNDSIKFCTDAISLTMVDRSTRVLRNLLFSAVQSQLEKASHNLTFFHMSVNESHSDLKMNRILKWAKCLCAYIAEYVTLWLSCVCVLVAAASTLDLAKLKT